MAIIIQFPRAHSEIPMPMTSAPVWRDVSTTIKSTGVTVPMWQAEAADCRILVAWNANNGRWCYRIDVRVQSRKPTPRQRFRSILSWTPATSLSAAMAAAESLIAA